MRKALPLLFLLAAALPAQHPNIVFLLADDMGFGDVQALNPDSKIPTPNLNRLAGQGMTFTDAHTGSAVCTPTRYGLITGRYSWRGKLKSGVLDGYGFPLIEDGRETVASFLKKQGYSTGIVGKWHLGLGFVRGADEHDIDFTQGLTDGPHTRGFDFSFIIPASLDFPPYVFIRNGQITRSTTLQSATQFPGFLRNGPRGRDLTVQDALDDLTAEAVNYIQQRADEDKPFFLYFPLTAPHKPALPHPRFTGATRLGPYANFVSQVDWTVGEVLNALESAGVAEETLVFYSSDNGSYMYRLKPGEPDHVSDPTIQGFDETHHTSNSGFRGTKADIYEAGHHVPFLVRWPGKVRPGSRTDATICLTDFFATVAEVTGAALPHDAAEDSFSLLPLLTGKGEFSRAPVIHHSSAGMFALRDGKWKFIAGNGSGGRQKPLGKPFERPYQLYDLSEDVGEMHNRIEQVPDVAQRMEKELDRLRSAGRSR
ncbi:MAG: sulfatase-like hydrolase/transferase [Acidobacteria bacterium]|nr:sulfatase-like hydrolase/transferase [Acidobacteriota bacterium]